MLDEVNTDVVERSWFWEERQPAGASSGAFDSTFRSRLLALARAGGTAIVDRTK